jgi:hypothetical protein
MIQIHTKRRRRKEAREDPNFVANGGSQTWWPMEGFKLGGQWKVPMLNGPWKEREKHFPPSFHFPPNKSYLNFYFTMVLNCYFTFFFSFP